MHVCLVTLMVTACLCLVHVSYLTLISLPAGVNAHVLVTLTVTAYFKMHVSYVT
jgi:hypothetical protein